MAQAQPFDIAEYEKIQPTAKLKVGDKNLRYALVNRKTLWRVESLFTKEPSTIEWLSSFAEGGIFLDVGANVGMYTVYAALVRNMRVFAFEPESQNFAMLCRNIVLNDLSSRVVAYPIALSDEQKFAQLHLSEFVVGGSCHSFDESKDFNLESKAFPFVQGAFSTRLDSVIADGVMPQPHHIKIDVDGFEYKVIQGGAKTFTHADLQSVLIEINPHLAEHRWIIEEMQRLGFHYDPKQVERAARQEGAFKGVGEYVFRR